MLPFLSRAARSLEAMHRTVCGSSYFTGEISQQMVLGNLIHTSTVVARSERLKKAGEYDQSVHPCEDQDYYYRVCKTGPVAHLEDVTIHYQIGADDAASGPSRSYELATSSLMVFNRLVEKEGVDLRIPREIVEEVSLELDRWVGIQSFIPGASTGGADTSPAESSGTPRQSSVLEISNSRVPSFFAPPAYQARL